MTDTDRQTGGQTDRITIVITNREKEDIKEHL